MAYRIDYGQPSGAKGMPRRRGQLGDTICVALAVFLLLTHFFWPAGRDALAQLLLPGDRESTGRAFSTLVEELQQGQSVGAAVSAFCRELLWIEEA